MAAPNHLKNIAIVGASGNIGTSILTHLLSTTTNNFHITIITRSASTSTFPSSSRITLQKGSYTDPTFLSSAFQGQDAVVFALGFTATQEQTTLISAAIRAGVKWILPTEYSADGANEGMMAAVPMFGSKVEARRQIEAEGRREVKWIGVVTNPWLEFSFAQGLFGIEIGRKKATLFEDAGAFNTSSMEQVGKGVAALLSLPITNPSRPRASLEHYGNGFVYISSMLTTQRDLLEAAKRATGGNWSVEKARIDGRGGRIEKAREAMEKGDMMAGADLVYAYYMGEGKGGDYGVKARRDAEVLGLEEEDLDRVVQRIVEGGWVF